jgi:DNA polymerase I-like protein with 3'-5' exonuclease and polymerase domains
LKPLTAVGLDTETEGFNPYLKKLLLLQLGNRDFQVVIDCMTINVQRYKEYLESDRLFIGWNLKFDVKFLFYHCIVPKNLYDGYLAEKMIWLGYPSGMHSLSLKSAGEHYLGVELDKTVRGQIIWKKELTDEIIEYAANDVKYLEDIMIKQKEVFRDRGQKELSLELENRAILPTAYFEHCGVYLNPVDWQEKMKKDAEALVKAQNELDEFIVEYYNQHKSNIAHGKTMKVYVDASSTNNITGKDRKQIVATEEDESFIISEGPQPSMESKNVLRNFPFVEVNLQASLFDGMDGFDSHVGEPRCIVNWNSSKQVIPLLEFFGFNLKVPDKEHGGMKKSVDATVIEGQKNIHPIAEVYLRFKAAQKVTSTYGQNFLDLRNPVTGRIHTQFNQIGTDTHRYSSGGGKETEVMPGKKIPLVNLQNLPADEITRSCFQAEPGNLDISRLQRKKKVSSLLI